MIVRICTALLVATLVVPAAAQDVAKDAAPDVLVKRVADEVLEIVRRDREIQAGNRDKTIALVQEKVIPHFNFTRMTALAMGINWRKASPEQQKLLVEEFRTLLVRTYSTALTNYRDQKIEYKPLRAQPNDADVTVRSQVRQAGAEPIAIVYSLEKTDAGWKVYDVAVAGVSLVTTYRDTFAQEVRKAGVDGLIKTLGEKNRQLQTKS